MLIERLKLFFAKYKIIKYCFACVLIGVVLYFAVKTYKGIYPNISETSKGIIGTLLGALVGGCFTLLGSLTINNKAQKATNAIKRKNIIFKPLYDELMEIHNEILIDDPYPSYIVFRKAAQTVKKHPQYTVWGRIQNDSRFFEVPTKLKKAMEALYNAIETYLQKRLDAVAALDRIYREEIVRIAKIEINDKANVGYSLLPDVLSGSRPDNDHLFWFNRATTDKEADELWDCLLMHAEDDSALTNCKEARSAWNKAEEETLKLLGYYIQFIAVKYEG